MSNASEAKLAGYIAYSGGFSLDRNPYKDSYWETDWIEGWDKAHREHEVEIRAELYSKDYER